MTRSVGTRESKPGKGKILKAVIVGAGPAGLTAGFELASKGLSPLVLEADPQYVGGISRTVHYGDYCFDIGGHRFFTKAKEVEELWDKMLDADDWMVRSRKSRIYYRRKFFSYPLKPFEALWQLGPEEAARCAVSYAQARVHPIKEPANFEDWNVNAFGRRLFEIFFKNYTEKVWGIPCTEISSDWAAQRIKNLSLVKAVLGAFDKFKPKSKAEVVTSLIEEFRYPRKGPGMLWTSCARKIGEMGGEVRLGCRVTGIEMLEKGLWKVTYEQGGRKHSVQCENVMSSAPLRDLVLSLAPAVPEAVAQAARGLRYRDYFTVALMVKNRNRFDDNWIYIQEPDVKVGRLQNFRAWSPHMVPEGDINCYGLEYFCFEGDEFWTMDDQKLVAFAREEICKIGLVEPGDFVDGTVVRQKKAYPIYDHGYADRLKAITDALQEYPGLHLMGRNGMHRYNNQDHSMMTALLAARNVEAGRQLYDVWSVNQEATYHEEIRQENDGSAGTDATVKSPEG